MIITIALSFGWILRQLATNNAFLNGILLEEVYMQQPSSFVDKTHPEYFCKLHKSPYGLKQVPRAWFDTLNTTLMSFKFVRSKADDSMFVFVTLAYRIYVLVYMDDMIITGSNTIKVNDFIKLLNAKFRLKDMGELHYFLGIVVCKQQDDNLYLSSQNICIPFYKMLKSPRQ